MSTDTEVPLSPSPHHPNVAGPREATSAPKLIREINRLHKQITEADQTSLDSAIEAGEMLIRLKKTVPHGEWADYLREKCPDISERTAQDYMWAANHRARIEEEQAKAGEENPQRAADLTSIRGAKRALAKPRSKKAKRKSTPKPADGHVEHLLPDMAADEVFVIIKDVWDRDKIIDLVARCRQYLDEKVAP